MSERMVTMVVILIMSKRMVMLKTVVTMGKSERMVTMVVIMVMSKIMMMLMTVVTKSMSERMVTMVVMSRSYLAFFNPSASLSSPGRNMS